MKCQRLQNPSSPPPPTRLSVMNSFYCLPVATGTTNEETLCPAPTAILTPPKELIPRNDLAGASFLAFWSDFQAFGHRDFRDLLKSKPRLLPLTGKAGKITRLTFCSTSLSHPGLFPYVPCFKLDSYEKNSLTWSVI